MGPTILARRREPERMDDPGLDGPAHAHALRGLARINWWSRSAQLLWPAIRDLALRNPAASLRVLDIACGGGDVPVALWRRARRQEIALEISGCDASPRAVALAADCATRQGAEISFFALDVLNDPLPAAFDVITCSLFLHHLDDVCSVALLRRMADAARRRILVNDLRRSRTGLALSHVAPRLLTRSRVVHVDAVRSAQAAYTCSEVADLAAAAGLRGARVRRRWPQRLLLDWTRE